MGGDARRFEHTYLTCRNQCPLGKCVEKHQHHKAAAFRRLHPFCKRPYHLFHLMIVVSWEKSDRTQKPLLHVAGKMTDHQQKQETSRPGTSNYVPSHTQHPLQNGTETIPAPLQLD